jgi:transcriptional regulator with XRE-family HTH domain
MDGGAIERGENIVSLVNIFRIAEALGVEPGELFQDLRSLSN